MNVLLIFFALPIATVIISIALQQILKNPLLVASIIFAIFLIVTFVIGDLNFLVATIIYTILSFLTAISVLLICRILRRLRECEDSYCNINNNNQLLNENETILENSDCSCETTNNTITSNANGGITARINIIPNSNTNGNTGCVCGNYRRR